MSCNNNIWAALSRQKVADAARKQINSKAIDAYSKLVDDMDSFVKAKQGPIECALEWTVASYPISAKHNPYYCGAFNGNECIRLLANVFEIFRNVQEAATSTESHEIEKDTAVFEIQKHHEIWEAFASVVPLLCSMRKLTEKQH
jgi:hypothetical protein